MRNLPEVPPNVMRFADDAAAPVMIEDNAAVTHKHESKPLMEHSEKLKNMSYLKDIC